MSARGGPASTSGPQEPTQLLSRFVEYEVKIPSTGSSRVQSGVRPPSGLSGREPVVPADPGSRPWTARSDHSWSALGLGAHTSGGQDVRRLSAKQLPGASGRLAADDKRAERRRQEILQRTNWRELVLGVAPGVRRPGQTQTPAETARVIGVPPADFGFQDLASSAYPEDNESGKSSHHTGARTAFSGVGLPDPQANPVLDEVPDANPRRMWPMGVDGALVDDLVTGNLTSLTLVGRVLSSRQIEVISEALVTATHIRSLNLAATGLSNDHVRALSRGLEYNRSLVSLDVSGNGIGDEGIGIVARACKIQGRMEHLYLQLNYVGPRGMYQLLLHMVHMEKIKSLDLSNNPIGDDGVRCFEKFVLDKAAAGDAKAGLVNLYLSSCKIGREGGESLLGSVRSGGFPGLKHLHCSDNALSDETCMELRLYASRNGLTLKLATSMADVVDLGWWVDRAAPDPLLPVERQLLRGQVDPKLPTQGFANDTSNFAKHESAVTGHASGAEGVPVGMAMRGGLAGGMLQDGSEGASPVVSGALPPEALRAMRKSMPFGMGGAPGARPTLPGVGQGGGGGRRSQPGSRPHTPPDSAAAARLLGIAQGGGERTRGHR